MLTEEMQCQWQLLMEQLKVKGSALQITACIGELKLLLCQFEVYNHMSALVLSLSQLVFW